MVDVDAFISTSAPTLSKPRRIGGDSLVKNSVLEQLEVKPVSTPIKANTHSSTSVNPSAGADGYAKFARYNQFDLIASCDGPLTVITKSWQT